MPRLDSVDLVLEKAQESLTELGILNASDEPAKAYFLTPDKRHDSEKNFILVSLNGNDDVITFEGPNTDIERVAVYIGYSYSADGRDLKFVKKIDRLLYSKMRQTGRLVRSFASDDIGWESNTIRRARLFSIRA